MIERRTFLQGLGAAIVAAVTGKPLVEVTDTTIVAVDRVIPRIYLRHPVPDYPRLSARGLLSAIDDLYSQVGELGCIGQELVLSPGEQKQIADMIDAAIDEIRPLCLQVSVETSIGNMVLGSPTTRCTKPQPTWSRASCSC